MIIREKVVRLGIDEWYIHSDLNLRIKNERGQVFDEVYDPIDTNREYFETDEPIPPPPETEVN